MNHEEDRRERSRLGYIVIVWTHELLLIVIESL